MNENSVPPAPLLPAIQPNNVEQITQSVSRAWLFDKRVVMYTVLDAQRLSIDAWFDTFKTDMLSWPADQPYLVLHDFSTKNAAATPYARQRAQELVWLRPELKGRAAILLPHTVASSMIQLFLQVQKRDTPRAQQAFSSYEKAIEWLLS